AGQDERADTIIVLDGVEHLHQSIDQCVIERVELLGPIQREQRDGPVLLDQDNFRHRGRRPSDPKITVAGHVLENSALDVVGQTPAVLIEPAGGGPPPPTPPGSPDGVADATAESPPPREASGGGIAMAVKSWRGAMAFMGAYPLIFETFSFKISCPADVDRGSPT